MAHIRRLESGNWQAVVKRPGTAKRYFKSDPLKRVVVAWAADLEQQIRQGDFVDPAAGRMTVAGWWVRWSETRVLEQATISKRESLWRVHVEPAFGSWPIATVQTWDVEAWVADLARRKVGPEAAASAFRLLSQLLGDAVRHRLIRTNPCSTVETPKAPKHVDRVLSDYERVKLLANVTRADRGPGVPRDEVAPRVPDPENRLLIRLMLDAGLRWQEAAGLHGFRVDLRRRRLRVQEVVERGERGPQIKAVPKTRAGQREVPLLDDLVDDLAVHLDRRGGPASGREGLLFSESDGRPLDYANWRKRVWLPAVSAAALARPLPTPHDCRHTFGTTLAEEGLPPHEIAALMGHSSLRAVERYLHASDQRMDRARTALSSRWGRSPAAVEDSAAKLPGAGWALERGPTKKDPASG